MSSVEWRSIKGYQSQYEVSNNGLVKSLRRIVNCSTVKFKRERIVKERILKQCIDRYGYSTVGLNDGNGNIKWFKVHRLVAMSFIGESNLTVNHKDLNKQNNNVDNLEYMSIKDNNNHFLSRCKRNLPTGEKHHNFKLSGTDKCNIQVFRDLGFDLNEVARCYGIHKHTIYKVTKKTRIR